MIKFDLIHIYEKNINDVKLNGIDFKVNGKTNYNKEPKDSLLAHIGETTIAVSNNLKIKKEYNINNDEELYMITFLTPNVKEMYIRLKELKVNCSVPSYDIKSGSILIPTKTKFQYMYVYPFSNSKFKFCFREIDTSTDLLNYQKAMIPNSTAQDIMGVKEIKIYDNFNKKDFEILSKIFGSSYIDGDEFSAEIYDNETLTITCSNEKRINIVLEVRGKALKNKELYINNEQKNKTDNDNNVNNTSNKNITFIY